MEKAEHRIAGLKSINPRLDLGDGLTLDSYMKQIELLRSQLATYNEALSFADGSLNVVQDTEQKIKTFSERMLNAVAGKYGKDSNEYELAGGTRKRDRKRTPRKPKEVA